MSCFSYRTAAGLLASVAFSTVCQPGLAQRLPAAPDTTRHQNLSEVTVTGAATHFAAPVDGTTLTAGRRNELIKPRDVNANLAQNNVRQVLARIPGLMVWENDGSGQQINIATRGLSPNRSWEFNTRQNGYDMSADAFGYPEAYYNPPMEAVERIQLLRGGAGLQFGPQFGGLLNYELKRGSRDKKVEIETSNTAGSNGLFNSYNAVGGTVGKVNYYAYYRHRQGDGWRPYNQFTVDDLHGNVHVALTERLTLGAEVSYLTDKLQQPGGLTDAQFAQDSRQSTRSRNWLSTPWLIPALTLDYKAGERTRLSLKTFGLVASRSSVGFVAGLPAPDTVNRRTRQFAARQVDRDEYRNLGAELRLTQDVDFLGRTHTLATGLRAYRATTSRHQRGTGTTGSDFDLTLTGDGRYTNEFDFTTNNAAAFAELLLHAGTRLSFTPGLRYDYLSNTGSGYLGRAANGTENRIPNQASRRNVLLYGLGSEFQVSPTTNLYANYSRAFRPVLFGDLVPPATSDVIDPNLKDARGYTAEVGYRGSFNSWLRFDVGYFFLNYEDRIGTIRRPVPGGTTGQTQQYRTNLGRTQTHGLEAYAELDLIHSITGNFNLPHLDLFAALSLLDARYGNLPVTTLTGTGPGTQIVETNLDGNFVENAPRQTLRTGLTFAHKGLSVTGQFSHVAKVYADASNTEAAPANAQTGAIPAYQVADLSATWKLGRDSRYRLSGGVNNVFDARYFTRRSGGYPGPGILPADGRTWFAGLGLML
ncbi:TonB-dependent receptor [Hymenobacter sp. BT186]|uniref:TonB-dependent receptor n=1 Tax=Hymenobacter telluris TaxID=2816474 RepID=A0A939F1R8_9BACT|nr:TonB-dependent receptor [Hymenobacter telluris]MBO0360500.1 TonB-dependent receptor [Hymenobacter telluris]MBW3376527.1 TonB-dependent receptor [Hymenobacter norwichensis]